MNLRLLCWQVDSLPLSRIEFKTSSVSLPRYNASGIGFLIWKPGWHLPRKSTGKTLGSVGHPPNEASITAPHLLSLLTVLSYQNQPELEYVPAHFFKPGSHLEARHYALGITGRYSSPGSCTSLWGKKELSSSESCICALIKSTKWHLIINISMISQGRWGSLLILSLFPSSSLSNPQLPAWVRVAAHCRSSSWPKFSKGMGVWRLRPWVWPLCGPKRHGRKSSPGSDVHLNRGLLALRASALGSCTPPCYGGPPVRHSPNLPPPHGPGKASPSGGQLAAFFQHGAECVLVRHSPNDKSFQDPFFRNWSETGAPTNAKLLVPVKGCHPAL